MKLDEEDDGWPDEPTEFNPDSLGPDPPTVTDYAERGNQLAKRANDVDEDTFRAFWAAVLAANYGVFAIAVGPMVVYFLGDTLRGTLLFATGVGALVYTYYQYRRNKSGT